MVVRVDEFGRRCDGVCYDAKHLTCSCICGGKNHGMGLEQALKNEGIDLDSLEEGMDKDEADAVVEAMAVTEPEEPDGDEYDAADDYYEDEEEEEDDDDILDDDLEDFADEEDEE